MGAWRTGAHGHTDACGVQGTKCTPAVWGFSTPAYSSQAGKRLEGNRYREGLEMVVRSQDEYRTSQSCCFCHSQVVACRALTIPGGYGIEWSEAGGVVAWQNPVAHHSPMYRNDVFLGLIRVLFLQDAIVTFMARNFVGAGAAARSLRGLIYCPSCMRYLNRDRSAATLHSCIFAPSSSTIPCHTHSTGGSEVL